MKVDTPRFDYIDGIVLCQDCPWSLKMQSHFGPDWYDCTNITAKCPTKENYTTECELAALRALVAEADRDRQR